jgi:hypothetical protein
MLGHFATVSGTVPDRFPALGQAAELVWKVVLDWLSSRRVFVRNFREPGGEPLLQHFTMNGSF